MLYAGVRRCGAGKWKVILATYPFNARRTPVDLKDKWRNVLKKERRRVKAASRTAAGQPAAKSGSSKSASPSLSRQTTPVPIPAPPRMNLSSLLCDGQSDPPEQ
jgi:Myb-like DNA-binding domain